MAKRNSTPEPRSAQAFSEKFNSSTIAAPLRSRKLKVRESRYDHQYRTTKRTRPYKPPVPVPWIQMKGYWLNQAGFTIGTEITVKLEHGRIILTPQVSTT